MRRRASSLAHLTSGTVEKLSRRRAVVPDAQRSRNWAHQRSLEKGRAERGGRAALEPAPRRVFDGQEKRDKETDLVARHSTAVAHTHTLTSAIMTRYTF